MAEATAYRCINVEEADRLLKEGGVLTLDVRDVASFQAGHIDGARHITFSDLGEIINSTPRSRPVIVCCYHGNASKEYANTLCDFGFKTVYSLDGGHEAWAAYAAAQTASVPDDALARWLAAQGFPEADVNAAGPNGMTPLMRACRDGQEDRVRSLIVAGARLEARNSDGNTALWLACVGGAVAVIDALVAAGANLDNCNDNGATALMYAASAGKGEVVACLLRHGADTRPETPEGFSALDLASTLDCLQLLRAASKVRTEA